MTHDAWCVHDTGCHDGVEAAPASAPPAARAWLLIEHPGPWPERPLDAPLPAPVRVAADLADALGIRVQMIRRPGRRPAVPRQARRDATPEAVAETRPLASVRLCWTGGSRPWLRRGEVTVAKPLSAADLHALSQGRVPGFGVPVAGPVILVCAHGHRNVCCARFGGPLARRLAGHYDQVWETTHVGGDRYAANLVILPHGLYYGPVDVESATAAITAYRQGEVMFNRYRGRAGQAHEVQEAQHAAMIQTGSRHIPGPA